MFCILPGKVWAYIIISIVSTNLWVVNVAIHLLNIHFRANRILTFKLCTYAWSVLKLVSHRVLLLPSTAIKEELAKEVASVSKTSSGVILQVKAWYEIVNY